VDKEKIAGVPMLPQNRPEMAPQFFTFKHWLISKCEIP
jgi:hypothetical protein